MKIDIVSDVVCPWCFVGKRRLEAALAARPELEFECAWRPFQLDPDVPMQGVDRAEYWQRKFGDPARLAGMLGQLLEAGAELGIEFDFEAIRVQPNTLRAHQLIQHASLEGRADAVVEALFTGFFERGRDIGDPDVLAAIAAEAGLDAGDAREALATGRHAQAVQAMIGEAVGFGIGGVPTVILGGRYAYSGAQPPEYVLELIDRLGSAR